MCESDDLVNVCGNYTDMPPQWGDTKKDADEAVLLTLGILVDLGIGTLFLLIIVLKYGEEIRYWMHARAAGRSKARERVVDYLRSSDHLLPNTQKATHPPAEEADKEESSEEELSVQPGATLMDTIARAKAKARQKRKSRRVSKKKSTTIPVKKPLEKKRPSPAVRSRLGTYRQAVNFLPISKAKPAERVTSSPDSASASSLYTAASIIGMTRPMPRWSPKKT
ncbi:unnamed protein product [Calicophoron daubneyi]|uniref:Uncharacterized protein n=1 Tax=Calicophoron daubneyi TaxID=300641 RepID=A0AAV2SZV5_CALDB